MVEDDESVKTENSLDKLLNETFGKKIDLENLDEEDLNLDLELGNNENRSNNLGFGNGKSKKVEKTKEEINVELSKRKPEQETPLDLTRPMNKDTYISHLIRSRDAPEMDKLLTALREAPTRKMMTEVLADRSNYPPMVYTFFEAQIRCYDNW